jgi:hypothetical protein
MGGDPRPNRLIRWRSWDDFEKGKWQDLSSYLPESQHPFTPYFITVDQGRLYIPAFIWLTDGTCVESRILQLDPATIQSK